MELCHQYVFEIQFVLLTFAVADLVREICNALPAALVRLKIGFLVRTVRLEDQITLVLNILN